MIDAPELKVDRAQALELYRRYKVHAAYQQPVDDEIASAFYQISKGRMVIAALAAVVKAGVNEQGLPKLAIGPADAKECHCQIYGDGSFTLSAQAWPRRTKPGTVPSRSFSFERGSFANVKYQTAKALSPYIPPIYRPKRALSNYTLLWEADWRPEEPPIDPLLLRRIGKGDLWLVLAQWDLSPIEAMVLGSRSLLGRVPS